MLNTANNFCLFAILTLVGKFCSASGLGSFSQESDATGEDGLTIDFGILEFPRGNVVVEQQIDLAECAVLGLGKAEPAPDVAEKVCASVEKASLGSPIPGYHKGVNRVTQCSTCG